MHPLSLISAFYESFDFFLLFHVIPIFYPKFEHHKFLGICSNAMPAVPLVISTHEWKNSSDFNWFWGFRCISTTKSRFFTHNEIAQDFTNILEKNSKNILHAVVPENFTFLRWTVYPRRQLQFHTLFGECVNLRACAFWRSRLLLNKRETCSKPMGKKTGLSRCGTSQTKRSKYSNKLKRERKQDPYPFHRPTIHTRPLRGTKLHFRQPSMPSTFFIYLLIRSNPC